LSRHRFRQKQFTGSDFSYAVEKATYVSEWRWNAPLCGLQHGPPVLPFSGRRAISRFNETGSCAMYDQFNEYVNFYHKYAVTWWNHLGPTGYLTLLSLVGVFGYVMMLKGPKRLT
jgi:hypothetical protein